MSQEAGKTVPDENEDNFEEDESFGDGEPEEDEANSKSSIGEGDYYDETEARKDVGELEGEFEGEDGDSEEPWGIDEYSAEGYAPP
jgi:hypothetical protein